jgi:TPP-dependent indolepyruvate ferredoxin oxidoreductase alpha subunit
MRNLRLLLTLLATICMLALGAYALARRPPQAPGDDIIIKGGSMQIQCGANHGRDCLGHTAGTFTYTHKKANAHITNIKVTDDTGAVLLDNSFVPAHQPTVAVTFK